MAYVGEGWQWVMVSGKGQSGRCMRGSPFPSTSDILDAKSDPSPILGNVFLLFVTEMTRSDAF